MRWLVVLVCLSSSSLAATIPLGPDSSLNLGVLVQSQGQLGGGSAPSGGIGTDFYLRRIRLLVHGKVSSRLSFFVDVDQPNLGKDGNWDPSFYIQDAFLSYAVVEKAFFVDAGMIIAPFSHHTIQGASTLNTLDYHAGTIKYPTGKVWRDVGVQLRGYAFDGRLQLRGGVFNGVEGLKPNATTGAAGTNPGDAPRLAAMARWNFLGKEEGFFMGGIYFSETPILSVGVGVDVQPGAVAAGAQAYSALSSDLFLELPTVTGQELIIQTNVYHFANGDRVATTGYGVFGEVGYRIGVVEPVLSVEYFDSDAIGSDMLGFRPGVNLWIEKHTFNVKLEALFNRVGNLREAPVVPSVAAQAQLSF